MTLRYKIFNTLHNYPVEIYLMWIIMVLTILTLLIGPFCGTSYSETYQFIQKL